MRPPNKRYLFTGLLIGSLWAFSEVVVGTVIRTVALPLRGTLLTGVGIGLLFAGYAYTRTGWTVLLGTLTTLVAKICFAPAFGLGMAALNGCFAVLLQGLFVLLCFRYPQHRPVSTKFSMGLAAALAMLVAGFLFYWGGLRLVPCDYLKSFTASSFFLREILPWSLFSAVAAPSGYALGARWKNRPQQTEQDFSLELPAWLFVTGCWLSCFVVVILTA